MATKATTLLLEASMVLEFPPVWFHDVDNADSGSVDRSTWVIWASVNTERMYQG